MISGPTGFGEKRIDSSVESRGDVRAQLIRVRGGQPEKARKSGWLPGPADAGVLLRVFALVACALVSFIGMSDLSAAADYRVRKSAQGLTFDIAITRNPPVLGHNEIRIEIKDAQGNPVLDAEVLVNYHMPPMPKMVPMNYTVPASLKGREYRAVMDFIMTGPWNIISSARVQGQWIRVAFSIDVR